MKTILALVTDAYGGRGGIAQAARDVIGAFAGSDGVEIVDVLPRRVAEEPLNLPAKVRQLSSSEGRAAYVGRALVKARSKPSLVFCNHLYMAPLAALVAWYADAKLIIQLHGIEIWEQPTRAQRAALERASIVLCVSRDTRARALTHCDLVPERAIVLNNTFDPRFTPGNRLTARGQFGLNDEFVLLTVGRLDARERYKGHDNVLDALPSLTHPDGRPILYLIAGEGDDRVRLEKAAQNAGLNERVRFLGQVSAADLPDLYRSADLFVLPSTREGFGIVFLEAMACGTLAVGIAEAGAPDALVDGELGVMVSSAEALSEALQTAVGAPRPDAVKLSAATVSKFGSFVFQKQIDTLLKQLAKQTMPLEAEFCQEGLAKIRKMRR